MIRATIVAGAVALAAPASAQDDFWSVPDAVGAEESLASDLYAAAAPVAVAPVVREVAPAPRGAPRIEASMPGSSPTVVASTRGAPAEAIEVGVDADAPVAPLLAFIGRSEAPGGYDVVFSGIQRQHHPPRPLTSLTVQEVLDWQDSIDRLYMSEAAGRYQVMEDTLRRLVREGKIRRSTVFNARTQDEVALALLTEAGWREFVNGRMSVERFGTAVAAVWAGLPALSGKNKGRSVYHGFNGNRATVRAAAYHAVLRGIRDDLTHRRSTRMASLEE